MRYDKLTLKAQEALQAAQEIAAQRDHQQIEPLHLLAALLQQQDGIVPPLLAKLGVPGEALNADLEQALAKLPRVTGLAKQYLSPAANEVLKRAFDESAQLPRRICVRRAHLAGHRLAGARPSSRSAPAPRREPRRASSGACFRPRYAAVTSPSPEATYCALEQYTRDLTD